MNKHQLWVERYRPTKMSEYIFHSTAYKESFEKIIQDKSFPHLLLTGSAGTGKTTLARVLFNELEIDESDVLTINASDERDVDTIRNKIITFISTYPNGPFKVVFLDEADYIPALNQGILRKVLEDFSDSARFILACAVGDTSVYTSIGYKPIKQISVGDSVVTLTGIENNKALLKKVCLKTIKISTHHGFSILVTPEHRFFTLYGDKKCEDLHVGDNILIKISSVYGNNFTYTPSYSIPTREDFLNYLKTIFPTQQELLFLQENKDVIFFGNCIKIFDIIIENNGNISHSPFTLAEACGVTIASARFFLHKIEKYIINKQRIEGIIYYKINVESLRIARINFTNEYKRIVGREVDNKNVFFKYKNTKNLYTAEEIAVNYPEKFTDEMILALGRLVGFFYGDGHLYKKYYGLHAAADNERTLKLVEQDLRLFNSQIKCTIKKNGANTKGLCLVVTNIYLYHLLIYYGAVKGNKTEQRRILPSYCYQSMLFSKGFIQGFFDSDATWCKVDKKTVTPIILGQIFSEETITSDTLLDDISKLLKMYFDIDSYVNTQRCRETGYVNKLNAPRFAKFVRVSTQADIKKYLCKIGNFYDKKRSDDILGYLLFKENCNGYMYSTFDEWKQNFYISGFINDKIKTIEVIDAEIGVYDCSLEEQHWYITNGFISHNCNYSQRIIPAIKSRCQEFIFKSIDLDRLLEYAVRILDDEKIQFDLKVLNSYIAVGKPDIRKIVNLLQQNSINGVLRDIKDLTDSSDYKFKLLDLLEEDKWIDIRKLVCENVAGEEWEDIYRFLYDNLHKTKKFKQQSKWDEGICIIAEHFYKHSLVADSEINFAACAIRLGQIG